MKFQVTKNEYMKAMLFHYRIEIYKFVIVMSIIIVGIVYLWTTGSINPGGLIAGIIGGIFGGGYSIWKTYSKINKHYDQTHKLYDGTDINYEYGIIDIKTNISNVKYKSEDIIKVKEIKDMFLLYITDIQFLIIPKRMFSGNEIDKDDRFNKFIYDRLTKR